MIDGDDLGGRGEASADRRWRGCQAPRRAMYVLPDGFVRSCCQTTHPLGHVEADGLLEMWRSEDREAFAQAVERGDLSLGCAACAREHEVEGPEHAYPRQFDHLALDPPDPAAGPGLLGLYFANTCNLQCIQCDGNSSSSIRLHREGLPPMRPAYDDAFFRDLAELLPTVSQVIFAGGEPFLLPEAFRSWELMAQVAPDVPCRIITNGTQWNDRIERALAGIRPSIVVSMDGATQATYERIRVGASFATVLANLDRFAQVTERAGTTLSINFCLIVDNCHEFADLLVLAEERGIQVDVSVVREPVHLSIYSQPTEILEELLARLEARDGWVRARLARNLPVWDAELDRLRSWLASATTEQGAAWNEAPILGLARRGTGPTDAGEARRTLAEELPGCPIIELAIGPDERIEAISDGGAALLGLHDGAPIGAPVHDLWGWLVARWGLGKVVLGDRTDDWHRTRSEFADVTVEAIAAALRDEHGRAERVALLLAVRDGTERSG